MRAKLEREKKGVKPSALTRWPSDGKKRRSFLHNLDKNVSGFRASKHKQLLNLFAPNFLVLGNEKKLATAAKVPQK